MNEVSGPDRPSGSVSSNPRGHRVPADVGDRAPSVWVLAGSRAGDRAQLTGLATTLGWPFQVKQLKYNVLNLLPNLVLGASLSSLDKPRSDDLSPPWPDLILDCGRKSVPAARWIRAQSAGRSRWVHLGRPWAPLAWFDLVVATPQYRVPRRDNVIQITLPFHTITADRLAAASAGWDRRLDALPRPWIAALVGGGSTSHVFDASAAERLGKLLSEATAATGGSLLITTSPRTSDAVAAALQRSITAPSHFHSWRDEGMGNPYLAFLALADRIVVTSD
ncbi:MAG: mitochondrial fission ELM1 family protein, partial [Dongiaceae bacterium]